MRWLAAAVLMLLPQDAKPEEAKRRTARAQTEQLAKSVELFGRFIGRSPRSLEELLKRPATLEPERFWPEGGFFLGGALPEDSWGQPFALQPGKVVCAGDGKEITVDVPPPFRYPPPAPTERLRRRFTARIQLQLLAAAARAHRNSTGALPRGPEGGWLPGGRMPVDPRGEPYRMDVRGSYVRLQVADQGSDAWKLAAEDRRALEDAVRPLLSAEDRKAIEAQFDALRDDDLETRDAALARLKSWGEAVLPLIEDRLKRERDRDVVARLEGFRLAVPKATIPWAPELGDLSFFVCAPASAGEVAGNERHATVGVKTLASAEAIFRAMDSDGNLVNDFWTGDVSGLYSLNPVAGRPEFALKLIEITVAAADAAPLEAGAAGGKYVPIATYAERGPKSGYWFQAMKRDRSVSPPEPYPSDTGGRPAMGEVHNNSRFGFCAFPAEYGVTGRRTIILNECNTLFWRDTGGAPVLEWPTDDEIIRFWKKLD
jgi:hypothetical protein